jgi:carbamoyl-phosphate synthase large subunit
MKATGEVMAIAPTFEQAIMKAVRGAEISHDTLDDEMFEEMSDASILDRLSVCDDLRLFCVYEALKRGISVDKIHEITLIDEWFLEKLINIIKVGEKLKGGELTEDLYKLAKETGFLDRTIEKLSSEKIGKPLMPVYKMVDTCAAEFNAETPYFYSTFDEENEAEEFIKEKNSDKKTVIVFGSGPIRIGQGIEFDYASVHCVWALKKAGYEVVIVNNNPETVSTDFDTADRLYFEPLTNEDVMGIIATEKPFGVVVAFGGQTAIKLTQFLDEQGVNILGTSYDAIDMAEDRERFEALLEQHNIARAKGVTVMTLEEALQAADKIGYPVLLRPSYVLGGQNMIIAFNEADVKEYMGIILAQEIENPILIDKYLMGTELEVDAICDGEDILIPGIMEHVERSGVHSGDSIAVYPAWNVTDDMVDIIIEATRNLALSLKTKGLVNIQYIVYNGQLNVIEVNPRSSRTIPYISKVTGVPMVDLATKAMLGEKLKDMGFGTGLYKKSPYYAVKVPVFSFEKLINVDNHLGPEMKSTGEVLGVAGTLEEALYKGLIGAGYKMKRGGGVLVTVRDSDKAEIGDIVKKYADMGFSIYATEGTADVLKSYNIDAAIVKKIHESEHNNTLSLIESGKIQYVISTSAKGRIPSRDSVKIRRKTVERNIPCLTSLDTANALADCLRSRYSQVSTELVDINNMRSEKMQLKFTKMQGAGNDYIYCSTFDQEINNPEALSVRLSDRHFGIGGDGIILVCPSNVADAKMRMVNLDGSEGKMCGNGIRCVGKYLFDHNMIDIKEKDEITVETLSGIKNLKAFTQDGEVTTLRVDMGKAELNPKNIPVNFDRDKMISERVTIGGKDYDVTCVSMGNPHCVVFVDNVDGFDLEHIGPQFENDPLFPERVNAEFVKVLNDHTIKMRVWERGSGETWACGTGACAVAVAACENGYCKKGEDITVKLKGGDLIINYTDDTVYMTGEATRVFDGVIEI